jgi:alanyl-tRNA synthetase
MSTKLLYYQDSYLREFDAQIVAVRSAGDAVAVVLDQTAFYSASGGQPNDLGTIAGVALRDVQVNESGEVAHILGAKEAGACPGLSTGAQVHCVVDWARRFDHMQQHTGQHVLSAAFVRLFRFETVGFHLGTETSTIDLAAPRVVPRHLAEAEELANRVVIENRPVTVCFRDAASLDPEVLRRAVERQGELRLVEIEDFDLCPCGGTHVARTGEIGPIFVRKVEKLKGNWRVEFVCGWRAIRLAKADFATLAEAARMFSCSLEEVPSLVRKQFEERKQVEQERTQLLARLSEYEARELVARAAAESGRRVIAKVFESAEANYLRQLATRLIGEESVVVLFANRATPPAIIFAQSASLPGDMGSLLRAVLEEFGGKGGGSKQFAQGSVPDASDADRILQRAMEKLRS